MGIDVHNGNVTYSKVNHSRLDTRELTNPNIHIFDGMPISAIFSRVAAKGYGGDGNALIYALKRINNYHISNSELKRFLPEFFAILNKITVTSQQTLIIPLPSSKNIPLILAKRAMRVIPNSSISTSAFVKKTSHEVMNDLIALNLPFQFRSLSKEKNKLIKILSIADPGKIFEMKLVTDKKLRTYISPIKLSPHFNSTSSILLVDDLISSGSTFISARNILLQSNIGISFSGLSLLGPLPK